MGVSVSKLKVNSHSGILNIEKKGSDLKVISKQPQQQQQQIDSQQFNVSSIDDNYQVLPSNPKQNDPITDSGGDVCCENVNDDHDHDVVAVHTTTTTTTITKKNGTKSNVAGYSQLKYIDDNDNVSEENEHQFRKVAENDNDSGNASISSDNSHHEDNYDFESKGEEEGDMSDDFDLTQLTLRRPRGKGRSNTTTNAFNFYSTLTNRLSTVSFSDRWSTQSVLTSQFEQASLKKLISKLKPGDLIEIRCLCNCLKGAQLRTSLNHRQRFRRTLQRQSFHQMPLSTTTTTKRPPSINFGNVFRRSCISGSMADLSQSSVPMTKCSTQPNSVFFTSDQCIEQFHYVLVQKISSQTSSSNDLYTTANNGNSVWCFHVRPYQRVALLEDDRHLGIVKCETLDSIVAQFLIEMEERHWQFGRGFKQPKLSVYFQIRNQEKLSQTILKQTLNAMPNFERVMELLTDVKDSYVRYHRTQCNSEHYATLWKYGIGWSSWANGRADIVRALQLFLQSLSQLTFNAELQLQGGECLYEQTNLIIQCFGLQGNRLEDSIRQWIQRQIVITKSSSSLIFLPPPSQSPKCELPHCHQKNLNLNHEPKKMSEQQHVKAFHDDQNKELIDQYSIAATTKSSTSNSPINHYHQDGDDDDLEQLKQSNETINCD